MLLPVAVALSALCVILAVRFIPSVASFVNRRIPSTFKWIEAQQRRRLSDPEIKFQRDVKNYQFPPLREKTSTRMAMGLKRLDESNWLTLDSKYLSEHMIRCNLLESSSRPSVIQCLPGSEAACHEVLEIVTVFMTTRFPQHFTFTGTSSERKIYNHLTKEEYLIGPKCPNPLEIAVKLSMEDFNIVIKHPQTGDYHLQASATLFPAGWKLQERIGTTIANLHAPVPQWKERLGHHVNRYFDHLSPKTSMERTNLFIQTTAELFQDVPESRSEQGLYLDQIIVRRERQTFTRLEKSGAVLFTVRTYMQPLIELGIEEVRALKSQILGWEEETKAYKGWSIWGEVVVGYCDEMMGKERVEVKD